MKPEARKEIRKQQILTFFNSYYYQWRLNHIMALSKLYEQRFDFFKDIARDTRQHGDDNGEATIAQEISNGIYFEAISASIQYIEDLFALLRAGKNADFFIRDIITFKAGKIISDIEKPQTPKMICEIFHFPFVNDPLDESDTGRAYQQGLEILASKFLELQQYHKKMNFFYNQYKHGLSIALRPFKLYSPEQIALKKSSTSPHYLVALDNMDPQIFTDFTHPRLNGQAFFPNFTEPIRANLTELLSENNMIRFVRVPVDCTFETITSVALKTKALMEIFINNFLGVVEDDFSKLRLPSDQEGKICEFNFRYNPFNFQSPT